MNLRRVQVAFTKVLLSPQHYRVLAFARSQTTIQQVKPYRIERIKNGMKFTCTHCNHSVTTLDFESKAGNLRTQAATAIHHHAAEAHHDSTTGPAHDAELHTSRI
ncbi:MAG: hypothetical protein ACLQIB_46110 [Isosphaeraceae bacterium]